MKYYLVDEQKEDSEPQTFTETHIPKEAISGSEILSIKNIEFEKKVQTSNIVGHKKSYLDTPIIDTTICPTCNKRRKITQDKDMDRNEIVDWFSKYITENKKKFTLDWLRGQKLTFESVNEMRKP